jgi:hypothetical protein
MRGGDDDESQNSEGNPPERGAHLTGLRAIERAIREAIRLLDPWPGYAVPTDELVAMLKKRYGQNGEGGELHVPPTKGLDELLEHYRRTVTAQTRPRSAEEWRD